MRRLPRETWAPIGLLLASVLLYGRSVPYPFVLDDRMAIVGNEFLKSPGNPLLFFVSDYSRGTDFGPGYFRPLMMLSFWLQGSVAGWGPAGFHLINIALHAVAAWCLFLAARALGAGVPGAAFGAALFAVFPPGHEPAGSIVGRADLLAAIFLLLGWRVQLRWERGRVSTAGAVAAVAGLGLLAMLGKESAAIFPALVLTTALFVAGGPDRGGLAVRGKVSRGAVCAAALLAFAGYLVLRHVAVEGAAAAAGAAAVAGPIAALPQPARTFAALYLTGQLLLALVWPAHRPAVPLNLSGREGFPLSGAFNLRVLLPAAGLAVILLAIVMLWRKRRLAALPLALALLALVPVSNLVVPTLGLFGERFLYLPFAGVALAAALGWDAAARRLAARPMTLRMARLAAGGLLVLLAALATERVTEWRSEEAIVSAWSGRFPNVPMVWNRLGLAALAKGDLDEARGHFGKSLDIDPGNARVNLLLGSVLERLGLWSEAKTPLQRAVSLTPSDPEPRVVLSRALIGLGRADEALREAEAAYALRPALVSTRQALGAALYENGRYDDAARTYRSLVEEEPGAAPLRHALVLSLDRAGRREEAEAEAREAAQRIPDNPIFDLWCARFAVRAGRTSEAFARLKEARDSGAPVGRWLHEVRDLEPLRDDPRARELAPPPP